VKKTEQNAEKNQRKTDKKRPKNEKNSRVFNLSTNQPQTLTGLASIVPLGGLAPSGSSAKQQASLASRFQVHPLQPLQKRDSYFSKSPTCFESTLTLLEPELNDQRDYQLVVLNEQGQAASSVRLRVASPLSPVLMISSAFVTIFGLFLCSLLFMFLFKRRHSFAAVGSPSRANQNGNGAHQPNGSANGSIKGHSSSKSNKLIPLDQNETSKGQTNGNSFANHHQGIVNGTGNGLANGASNPASGLGHRSSPAAGGPLEREMAAAEQQLQGGQLAGAKLGSTPATNNNNNNGNLLSMASSDASTCNDQRQLLCSSGSSQASEGAQSGGSPKGGQTLAQLDPRGLAGATPTASSPQGDLQAGRHFRESLGSAGQQQQFHAACDRSTANSSPSVPMNHISVDDELQLTGPYADRPAEATGALHPAGHPCESPPESPPIQVLSNQHEGPAANLIYANIDYNEHPFGLATMGSLRRAAPNEQLNKQQQQQQQQHTLLAGGPHTAGEQQQVGVAAANSPPVSLGHRSSVGATIAMMNSLAAAAAAAAPQASPGQGALTGAINQQLSGHRGPAAQGGVVRKPGPPKPPKPSIQQRSRFYQQQLQQAAGQSNGLVMIGTQNLAANATGQPEQQKPLSQSELAMEYSRLAFPARAEL